MDASVDFILLYIFFSMPYYCYLLHDWIKFSFYYFTHHDFLEVLKVTLPMYAYSDCNNKQNTS